MLLLDMMFLCWVGLVSVVRVVDVGVFDVVVVPIAIVVVGCCSCWARYPSC